MIELKRIIKYIPFTYMWMLRRIIGDSNTILDLGCGDGELMQTIGEKNWKVTGVDIFKKSLKKAERTGMYDQLIQGDLLKVCRDLVKKRKKYDLVFCSQVVEHITKKKGEKLLDVVEKLTDKKIYFGTPRGFMVQPEIFIGDNPSQHHQSGWSLDDFRKRGYKVNGVGLMISWSESGFARSSNTLVSFIFSWFSYLLSPIAYFFPSLASGILAIKDMRKEDR